MTKFNVNYSYPRSEEYDYSVKLKRVDLDKKRIETIANNKGFFVQGQEEKIQKHMKEENGLFSNKFGRTLDDTSPFISRYSCKCGRLQSVSYAGMKCDVCGTEVKYVDDDFKYMGWITLKDPYFIIHPNLFKAISSLIGPKTFLNILRYVDKRDIDGHIIKDEEVTTKKKKAEPYEGIGLKGFKEKFDEVCDYYLARKPNKIDLYNSIMENREKVFTQSIPVYSALLRPVQADTTKLFYEETSAKYFMILKYANTINNDDIKIYKKVKNRQDLLYRLTLKVMELYGEIEKIMAGKKGNFRNLFAGRWAFTSRTVIAPNPALAIDEVALPYQGLVKMLQQKIVNILTKTYSITYSEAHNIWFKAQSKQDPRVRRIIQELIDIGETVELEDGTKVWRKGITIVINRNPTIAYGSMLQMFCVDINDSYTMGMPLQILKLLGADFDGDVLTEVYIIEEEFKNACYLTFNPANCFYISNNDGELNADVLYSKDTVINLNSLLFISRNKYTDRQMDMIRHIKEVTDCI